MAVNKLIHVGFGNIVNAGKIIAIVSPDSAPVRRLVSQAKNDGRTIDLVSQAKNDGRTIDATQGRKTKSVIVMENDRIVLSALLPETIRGRAMSEDDGDETQGSGQSPAAKDPAETDTH